MTPLTLFLALAAVAAIVLGVAPVRRRPSSAPKMTAARRRLGLSHTATTCSESA